MLECEDCGKISEDVERTNCPYAREIHDENKEITVCEDCKHERAMGI